MGYPYTNPENNYLALASGAPKKEAILRMPAHSRACCTFFASARASAAWRRACSFGSTCAHSRYSSPGRLLLASS